MEFRIEFARRAERALDEAYDFIANDSVSHADQWYFEAKEAVLSLKHYPARCGFAYENDLVDFELRQLVFGKRSGRYRILFTIDSELRVVHIIAIRHSAQDTLGQDNLKL